MVPELQNPIFPALAEVVAGALAQRGFTPCSARGPGSMSEADYVDMLLDRHVSGMIFAGGHYAEADAPHEHYDRLLKRRLPVVLVNAAAEHLDFPRSPRTTPSRSSRRTAISLPRARADWADPRDPRTTYRRAQARGVRESDARRRPAGAPRARRADAFSLEGGHAAATRLLAQGVTGIICASDPLALGAIRAARRAGLSVPEDVSVIGYDDSAFMNCTDPPLTTVRQPIEAIGRAAVEMLVGQIEGAAVSTDELFFEPEMVARGSTAAARR